VKKQVKQNNPKNGGGMKRKQDKILFPVDDQ
jgi:hypothetical protein